MVDGGLTCVGCVNWFWFSNISNLWNGSSIISFTVHIMHRLSYTSLLVNVSCFTYDTK